MSLRTTLAAIAVMVLVSAGLLWLVQRQLSGPWLGLSTHPEILDELETSLEDQKTLAAADPDNRAAYRRRFEEIERLTHRLRILELNRERVLQRTGAVLAATVAVAVLLAGALLIWRQRRDQVRLAAVEEALTELAAGSTDLHLPDRRRRDALGLIATAIERTSRTMARDRRRLASLENLSAWQEAARRQAHEIRTPLTAARLRADRLERRLPADSEMQQDVAEIQREIDRLNRFTQAFTAFARLPAPHREAADLGDLVREFADTFAGAWPQLSLTVAGSESPLPVRVDGGMLRQVLANLCANAAQAGASAVTFTARRDAGSGAGGIGGYGGAGVARVEVADDGPGVAEAMRPRLFAPYATSRRLGDGMGLGLAISRKILLDHGGDLELARSSDAGAVFRLTLPIEPPEPSG